MSSQEVENLSKADLKKKLNQMGMSLDRIDHPRDYYVQLYLERSNDKNKVTRGNTPYYRNKILHQKRGRGMIKETDKELIDDPNYEEEEYEEEEEIFEKDDEDLIYEESEEKEKKNLSKRKNKKVKIDEKTNDYRESGIKITRLIRKKKEKMPKVKEVLARNENQQNSVRRRILNNYNEMAGENDDYDNNNSKNYLIEENAQNKNINITQDYKSKNNEFYNLKNNTNMHEKKTDVISLKVERVDNYGENKNYNNINHIDQNLCKQIKKEYNKTYLLGNPKEPCQNKEVEIKSKNNIVSFGAPNDNNQMNIHNISNGPISFGVKQSSIFSSNTTGNEDEQNYLTKKTGNDSKQYDYFIKNISESIKEDVKDNHNSFKQKVLIKWDTPKQKEFLISSMLKEQTFKRPSEEEMNNINKVNLQSKFEAKENESQKILINNQPRNQIISDSIQNTTINKDVIGNYNYNINNKENNNYKAKLRSFRPKNEIELNNSNSLNTNKEIISKKVEKDNNNINEIEYSHMNKNDNYKDNLKFHTYYIQENTENMNINRDENMNNYRKSNNNFGSFKNENNNMNNYTTSSYDIDKYNKVDDNAYSNENNNRNNNLNSSNNLNNYNNKDDNRYLNNNIGQSNLNNFYLLNDNDNNNIKYRGKDIEMNDNNNMKYLYNDDKNNTANEVDIEMKDNSKMKYFSNEDKNNIIEKDIEMKDNNNMKFLTNDGNNNYNFNINNYENINNLQKENLNYDNAYNKSVNDTIKFNNENKNMNHSNPNMTIINDMTKYNDENENINNVNMINDDTKNINYNQMNNQAQIYVNGNNEFNNKYQSSGPDFKITTIKNSNKIKFASNLKNRIINKFKNNAYLWPLIVLIVFGLFYFLNRKFENFSNLSLIFIFSLIMGLIILYNLLKYIGHIKNYKKMAKEDRDKLIEYLKTLNITREEFGNNLILINNFIKSRIQYHNIKTKEYKDYVFPYLIKYLKKDNLCLKIEDRNIEINNIYFWKEI